MFGKFLLILCPSNLRISCKEKKSLASSTKSAAYKVQCLLHHLSGGIIVAWPLFRNEIAPLCIMLKQTDGPVSRFSHPFPCPIYFPYGIAVLPRRYLRSAPSLPARNRSIIRYFPYIHLNLLFDFCCCVHMSHHPFLDKFIFSQSSTKQRKLAGWIYSRSSFPV